MNDWRRGLKPVPDERIRQLAKFAGQDPGVWLLLIHSEQDEGDLGREWAKLYKRLASATIALLICIGTALHDHAKASQLQQVTMSAQDGIGYIMRNWQDGGRSRNCDSVGCGCG
ncbi:DUF3693 domain-containing protein [Xanthomonas albilineans]|uniref:DUF3693 domain-containing protein n=1 Tax=Xanthomonas albilineans TaxID=29447 RepID=UPI00280B03C3|nr:DUF3693 domain-containing protein [Xanthomonas albilineans]